MILSASDKKKLAIALLNAQEEESLGITLGQLSDYSASTLSSAFEIMQKAIDDNGNETVKWQKLDAYTQKANGDNPTLVVEPWVLYRSFDIGQIKENEVLIKALLGKGNMISIGRELLRVHQNIHIAIPFSVVHIKDDMDNAEGLNSNSFFSEDKVYYMKFEPAIAVSSDGKYYTPCAVHELMLHKILNSFDKIYQENSKKQDKMFDEHCEKSGLKIYEGMSEAEKEYILSEKELVKQDSMKDRAAAAGFNLVTSILNEYKIPFSPVLLQELSISDEAIKKAHENKAPLTILLGTEHVE